MTKTSARVDPDAYYAITVTWKSGIGYQVPCRGRQLSSYLTRYADNDWLQRFVSREITQAQYHLLMYGPVDESVPSVRKVTKKDVAKKAVGAMQAKK